MPFTTIALGFGHLPQDHARNTELDVHLHLDHPATPISLGERSGPQSIGNGFTLQDATEYRMEEHLRACGCDWLRQVAVEERLSGRIFTPAEILQRRPAGETALMPAVQSRREPATRPGALETIRKALAEQDFEAIEGLRDMMNEELTRQVAEEWRPDLPWEIKDAYAALLMDRTDGCVKRIFYDALRSPTVESRAYAVCVLKGNFKLFDYMLVNGSLDPERVDTEASFLDRTL